MDFKIGKWRFFIANAEKKAKEKYIRWVDWFEGELYDPESDKILRNCLLVNKIFTWEQLCKEIELIENKKSTYPKTIRIKLKFIHKQMFNLIN